MSRLLQFVAPHPSRFPSGGNHYNAMLARALSRQGVRVVWCTPERANAAWPALWDTLWLDRLRPAGAARWLIVHHLQWLWPERALSRTEELRLLSRFDGLVVTSPFTAEEVRAAGLRLPLVVVPPGVAWRRPHGWRPPSWPLRILWSGNFIPRKGLAEWLESLLPVAPSLASRGHALSLLGSDRVDAAFARRCHGLVGELNRVGGRQWVRYEGAVRPQDVPRYLAAANLFVSTSRMETWGMAIAEAGFFGLPVWVCRGGFAERHLARGCVGAVFEGVAQLTEALLGLQAPAFARLQARALAARPDYPSWEAGARLVQQALWPKGE